MITLVGVGHVFDLHSRIREIIVERRPRVVGVELDRARYLALLEGGEPSGPWLYRSLARMQEALARQYGAGKPGSEMLAAVEAGREVGSRIEFIDMDARKVLDRLVSDLSAWESVRLLANLVGAMLVPVVPKRLVDRQIRKIEEHPERAMEEIGKRFPTVKKGLIDDRDEHMARRLRELAREGWVVAVVGDGHVAGLRERLTDTELEVIRLVQLRRGSRVPPPPVRGGERSTGVAVSARPGLSEVRLSFTAETEDWPDQTGLEGGGSDDG